MDVVAAISAAISLVALVISIVVAKRQTGIQERLAAIEEARRAEEVAARGRARVTASMRPDFLTLHNEGPALARGVGAEIVSLDEDPLPFIDGIEALPVDLQPGQPITFAVSHAAGDANTLRVTVRWADESGDHEEPYTLRFY